MNAQIATRMLLASFLVPAMAFAQAPTLPGFGNPVKPRVIIIFDTSTSMQVAPDDQFGIVFPMSGAGGDFDPANQGAACDSKFCIAKKVVYNTLPQYADAARIGLATYFQFLVEYSSTNTQSTTCYYDKMWKAGYAGAETTFTSATDYTGGLGGDVGTSSGSPVFPDSLLSRCSNPANGATKYIVKKTLATPGVTQDCADFTYPARGGSFKYTAAPSGIAPANVCNLVSTYTMNTAPVAVNQTAATAPGSAYTIQYIGAGGSSCPATTLPLSGGLPMGGPSSCSGCSGGTIYGPVAIGTGVNQWQGLGTNECSSNTGGTPAGCTMFSANSNPVSVSGEESWYALQVSPFVPASSPANTTGTASTYGAVALTGNVTGTNPTCIGELTPGPQTYNTGIYNWASFGIGAAAVTGQLPLPGGSTNTTPGWNNPSCNAAMPCVVTYVTKMLQPLTYTNVNINYNVPGATGSEVITAAADITNGATHFRKAGTCPGSPAVFTANPPTGGAQGWVAGAAPTGCGTGRGTCDLHQVGTANQNNGCTGSVTTFNGNAPAACNGSDGTSNAYTLSTTGTQVVHINAGVAGTCPAVNALLSSPAPCTAGKQCKVSSVVVGTTGTSTSSPVYNKLAPPSPYTGSPTGTTNAGTTWLDPASTGPACPAAGETQSTDPTVCGASGTPCTVVSNGLQNYGAPIGETQPQKCQFTREQFTWTAANVDCAITTPSNVYTTATTYPVCLYDQYQWTLTTPNTQQVTCTYSANPARFDYTTTANKYCEYYRMKTVNRATAYNYTYQYTTKGGELASYRSTAGGNPWATAPYLEHHEVDNANKLCSTSYNNASGFSAGQCPPIVDNCDGNPNQLCKLRWGRPISSAGPGAAGTGRYSLSVARNSQMCLAPDYGPTTDAWHVATQLPSADITTNTVTGTTPLIDTACMQSGSAANLTYKLFSDWYQSGTPNVTPTTSPSAAIGTFPVGYTTARWNNQASKESGWSGIGGSVGVAPTPSQILVPVPADNDPTGGKAALQQALGLCDPPDTTNVTSATLSWAAQGACMVSDYYRNTDNLADFTPLYGSLVNAKKYISDLKTADPDVACRPYYVVLATDGLESTPAHRTDADLTQAVNDLTGITGGPPVQTFVIGFGNAVTGTASASLDSMASAGGTGSAFTATNQASLQTSLSLVFNQITQGTFSRSKPTISTDGKRIYAAQFTRISSSPEWKGELFAFEIDPATGNLTQKWEYSNKLNGQADNTRTIKTDVSGAEQAFTNSNATVLARLNTNPSFPVGLTTANVVDFLRNPGVPSGTYANYFTTVTPTPQRQSRAADILHSSAVVVSKSPFGSEWGGTNAAARGEYANFQAATSNRPTRVVFGANDGMLHSLYEGSDTGSFTTCLTDENDPACPNGTEAWAWVPSELQDGLYRNTMQYNPGVDNTISVADVCGTVSGGVASDATNCTQGDWTTVSIGSLREGGRSLFGLEMKPDGSSKWLWNFSDSALGNTWSAPAIGRVKLGGAEQWLAVFGGGTQCASCSVGTGGSMYAIDALSGQLYDSWTSVGAAGNQMAARPAMFRRPVNPLMDTIVSGGSDGVLQVMRFASPSGAPLTSATQWAPVTFFDPMRNQDRDNVTGVATPIMTVSSLPTSPPTYLLGPVTTGDTNLPLTAAGLSALGDTTLPPLLNRPKVAAIYDGSGNTGDYYVGTGDVLNPVSPAYPTNFFYGLHDRNQQPTAAGQPDDGQPLWVVRFPNTDEEVVSEPAIINGAVIVATYVPPPTGSQCTLNGDTTLYAFDPKSGALTQALVYPPTGPGSGPGGSYAGKSTSVVSMKNVGIPSDLLVVGDTLYMSTSNGGVTSLPVKPTKNAGDIRSFRRIR